MEPPGGTHTTTDLYSKLSADPTIFATVIEAGGVDGQTLWVVYCKYT